MEKVRVDLPAPAFPLPVDIAGQEPDGVRHESSMGFGWEVLRLGRDGMLKLHPGTHQGGRPQALLRHPQHEAMDPDALIGLAVLVAVNVL